MVQNIKQIFWDDEGLYAWIALLVPDNKTIICEGGYYEFLVKAAILNSALFIIRFIFFENFISIPGLIILLILSTILLWCYLKFMDIVIVAAKIFSIQGLFVVFGLLFAAIVLL